MYDHRKLEEKWQEIWRSAPSEDELDDPKKPKYFVLDMFPYPSGSGLHAGHVESYTATDIMARYQRLRGRAVLYPQGFDSFGLPAENYAIKTGVHPTETTLAAISNFRQQMDSLGLSYDWERMIRTSDPEYYRWTQWMFLQLYKEGLAYKKQGQVNWCESCQTVLANEQAEGGVCERCGQSVIQKNLDQWFFRISDFIEDQERGGQVIKGLLSGLDDLDWPESTKAAQRNWIGRSEGAEIIFPLAGRDEKIQVFTTRVDTVYGCTYVVLSPEHPLLVGLESAIENQAELAEYQKQARAKTELQRTDLEKEKTGLRLLGLEAVNPFNNEKLPVYVADYVIASYGTGAVMAVPAHDERDRAFALKYGLEIRRVIQPQPTDKQAGAETADGVLLDSGEYTGLESEPARQKMSDWLEASGNGRRRRNYRLRDWLVSRQRYWGAPIPIIYCPQCGTVPVPEAELPVRLPEDVDFRPTGESPLKYSASFQAVACPACGTAARRESDTMDTFVCSSWYYLRYSDPKNAAAFAAPDKLRRWLPVDIYLGGAEHSVLHLLYARFFTKFLQRAGYLDFNEPFLKLRHQGIILGEDGNKMSKSKGNVVNPDSFVQAYGADSLRLYIMFMGPLEDMKPWNSQGIIGVRRFLDKVHSLAADFSGEDQAETLGLLHKTIRKVGSDIEALRYNTAISALMIFVNKLGEGRRQTGRCPLSPASFEKLLIILSPFAPHLAEELWSRLKPGKSVFSESWPEFDPALVQEEAVRLIIQVDGKMRAALEVAADIDEEAAFGLARQHEAIARWLAGREIARTFFVPGRLLNIVLK